MDFQGSAALHPGLLSSPPSGRNLRLLNAARCITEPLGCCVSDRTVLHAETLENQLLTTYLQSAENRAILTFPTRSFCRMHVLISGLPEVANFIDYFESRGVEEPAKTCKYGL